MVPSNHELVAQLREQGLYPFSGLSEYMWLSPIFRSVDAHRRIQLYIAGSEQAQFTINAHVLGGKVDA